MITWVMTMKEMYGLGFFREQEEPYCFPLPLEQIDALTTSKTREELLNIIKTNDSTVTETDSHKIAIFKSRKNHWKPANLEYISKENEFILTFSLEELFDQVREEKLFNVLFSHFSKLEAKQHISENMRNTIHSMKGGREAFFHSLKSLSYEEMRLIRVYLAKNFDVKHLKIEEQPKADVFDLAKEVDFKEEYRLEKKKSD